MLQDKILSLFELRKLPYLAKLNNVGDDKLWQQLIDLQASIYYFDHYLENNWILNQKEISEHWNLIYSELKKLGYSDEEAVKKCAHIHRYAIHESQLRESKTPLRLNFEYFYYYKSCDVRLMREILFQKSNAPAFLRNISDWRYFDLITEIYDDVEDVFEDVSSINANAFLISMIKKGKAYTQASFFELIELILEKAQNRTMKFNNEINKNILEWTIEMAADTKDLIKKQIDQTDLNEMKSNSKLENYWR